MNQTDKIFNIHHHMDQNNKIDNINHTMHQTDIDIKMNSMNHHIEIEVGKKLKKNEHKENKTKRTKIIMIDKKNIIEDSINNIQI